MDFTKPLLAIFAHPDDESFGMAGTVALFAEHGAEVTILTLTRGERGSSHLKEPLEPEELGRLREQELRDATGVLGVSRIIVWGYPDGGLTEVPEEELRRRIIETIDAVKPHILITFEPGGISGHRDHIVTSCVVTDAFLEVRKRKDGPKALYYRAIPSSAMQKLRSFFAHRRRSDVYERQLEDLGGVPDEKLIAVDVSRMREKRRAAMQMHRSQNVPDFEKLGKEIGLERFADTEHFLQY